MALSLPVSEWVWSSWLCEALSPEFPVGQLRGVLSEDGGPSGDQSLSAHICFLWKTTTCGPGEEWTRRLTTPLQVNLPAL